MRKEPHERIIRFAFTRRGAHLCLEHIRSIATLPDPIYRVAATFRRQENHNNDPACNHAPRTRGRHGVQNTLG